ncbi:unnamed protein product [Adineta ricciae]|uniref:Uncharacterized protein n=1 Tax=Adineta ricciae TaxID=249248 RepID=A0A815Z0N7_ADIRI|nr:unnamed protein product [Adineta ricciae]CAF1577756.1 unnamed protein product [Adineta ricciae]
MHDHLMTPNVLCQESRSLIVRAVNVTMRAFQKAGQFQLSSAIDDLLVRRRYTKRSTDSCSSISSSATTTTILSFVDVREANILFVLMLKTRISAKMYLG